MKDILKKSVVLVINKCWQAINIRTPEEALVQMSTDGATGLDIDGDKMIPVRWNDWLKLPVREGDFSVLTARGPVRIPTVIVLAKFARVPMSRPKLSSKGIWDRDGGVCQYTGRKLAKTQGNIDHVLPRSKNGKTSWENCVLADRELNSLKADRLPHEVGLKLIRSPRAPRDIPVTLLLRNHYGIQDWKSFLVK